MYIDSVWASPETHILTSTACYVDRFPCYMYMMFLPHRKHSWASTTCYWESFTFLYIDDVRTSQEAHASTACYWDSFIFNLRTVD
jgi:hypothetical protein